VVHRHPRLIAPFAIRSSPFRQTATRPKDNCSAD